MIQESEGVPVGQQQLIFAGRKLRDVHTLACYNIKNHDVLLLRGGMNIFIENRPKKTLTLQLVQSDTIDYMKVLIQEKTGIPVCVQRLICQGRGVYGDTLADCKIQDLDTIHLRNAVKVCGQCSDCRQ